MLYNLLIHTVITGRNDRANMLKPATFHYNRPVSQEEQKRVVINLYESGIAEEFIALQLDLEIPAVISILKEYNIYKGNFE
jgi:hypothetical protein